MIDHELLYSDKAGYKDWKRIMDAAKEDEHSYWRTYARKKLRRIAKQLLAGVRPNVYLGNNELDYI